MQTANAALGARARSFTPSILVLALLSCSAYADNLADRRGAVYRYVDDAGKPVPNQLKDAQGRLTDGKERLKPVTGKGTMRVLFDFGVAVSPRAVNVITKSDEKFNVDTIGVYAGDSLDTFKKAAEAEASKPENGEYAVTSLPIAEVSSRFIRVDLSGKHVAVTEIEVVGSDEDVAAIEASGGASTRSTVELLRQRALEDAAIEGDVLGMLMGRVKGLHILTGDLSESAVRDRIRQGHPGDLFYIENGASWILTETLHIPEGVGILGSHPGGGEGLRPSFIKGFDGPLATLSRFVTIHGVVFDGNRDEFDGDGVVAGGDIREGVREVRLTRVEIVNNRGHGYVMSAPHYYSEFNFCTFDSNGGYGTVYGAVRSHHTDNVWNNCHYAKNGQGGVAFYGMEASSVWQNCEFFHNGGPAFDHFLIEKKLGDGREIGPRPESGADVLVIRHCVIRNHAGPVWLQREGRSESIVFEDNRIKKNGSPEKCELTAGSGKTAAEMFGLTEPVGVFHVEKGKLNVELRGGFAWGNVPYLFTAAPESAAGNSIHISGAAERGGVVGHIHIPNGYCTIHNAALLTEDAMVNVKSGIGLDPINGEIVRYGPVGIEETE